MFLWVRWALVRTKTIFVPSGDQPGSRQLIDLGSENSPPHPGVIGSWCSPLPSASTTQIASRWSGVARAAAVEPDHEDPNLAIRSAADENHPLAVGREVARDVDAARVGSDPCQAA